MSFFFLSFLIHYISLLPQTQVVSPDWKPDFGPANFVPSWGASATGARKFLIAYNVNVLATKEQCHRIALNVREKGRGPDQVRGFAVFLGNIPNLKNIYLACIEVHWFNSVQ